MLIRLGFTHTVFFTIPIVLELEVVRSSWFFTTTTTTISHISAGLFIVGSNAEESSGS